MKRIGDEGPRYTPNREKKAYRALSETKIILESTSLQLSTLAGKMRNLDINAETHIKGLNDKIQKMIENTRKQEKKARKKAIDAETENENSEEEKDQKRREVNHIHFGDNGNGGGHIDAE